MRIAYTHVLDSCWKPASGNHIRSSGMITRTEPMKGRFSPFLLVRGPTQNEAPMTVSLIASLSNHSQSENVNTSKVHTWISLIKNMRLDDIIRPSY